jgi:hypothetical protein
MPSFTIEELGSAEQELLRTLAKMTGTIEEKAAQLRSGDIGHRYAEIFLAYVSLATPPSSAVEALKRAMFLAWYAFSEPPVFTGLGELPEGASQRVLALIEPLVPGLDSEFRWMLAWYYMIADFAFPTLNSCPMLDALLRSEDPSSWRSHRSASDRMRGRGAMGKYWISVFASNAA